jgi:hypothetical protein
LSTPQPETFRLTASRRSAGDLRKRTDLAGRGTKHLIEYGAARVAGEGLAAAEALFGRDCLLQITHDKAAVLRAGSIERRMFIKANKIHVFCDFQWVSEARRIESTVKGGAA